LRKKDQGKIQIFSEISSDISSTDDHSFIHSFIHSFFANQMEEEHNSDSDFEEPFKSPVKYKSQISSFQDADKQQADIEADWGDNASAVWKASFKAVQDTWKEILEKDIKKNQWGLSDTECCWEIILKASNNGRPTKEIKRVKTRRTKEEISRRVPLKSTKRVRPYCTHIALRAVQKFPLPRHKVTDASHLCHNPLCVRPEHLIVESRTLNHKRKNCLFKVMCQCCSNEIIVCKHNPPCLHAGDWQDEERDESNNVD
jgi:hypothetical protein